MLLSIASREIALRYYDNLKRSERGLYFHDRVYHGLRTYITRDFLPSDENGRVDVQYVCSMIDFTHAVAYMNMHAPDSNLLPRSLTDNDKAECVTIAYGLKKEWMFFLREFIQTKLLNIFYPNDSVGWKEKRNKLNSKVAGHILKNETAEVIEIISKVYHHNLIDWCEEFMEEHLLVYKDNTEGDGCIKKLLRAVFNEITKTFPVHVNKMSPQELEKVETVADLKFTEKEGKKLLFKYLQSEKQVEQENPENERLFANSKKRGRQMCLWEAYAAAGSGSCVTEKPEAKKPRHVPVITPADKDSSSEHEKLRFVTPRVKLEFSSPQQPHDAKAFIKKPSQSELDSAPRFPIFPKAPSVSSSNGTIDLLKGEEDDKKISASAQEAFIIVDDDDSDDDDVIMISEKLEKVVKVEPCKFPSKKFNYESKMVHDVKERLQVKEQAEIEKQALIKKQNEVKLENIKARAEDAIARKVEDDAEKKQAEQDKQKQIEGKEPTSKKQKQLEKKEKAAQNKLEKAMKDLEKIQKDLNELKNDGKYETKEDDEKTEMKKVADGKCEMKGKEKEEEVENVEKKDKGEWEENEFVPMDFGSRSYITYYNHLTCADCKKKFEDAYKKSGMVYFQNGAKGVKEGGSMLCFPCFEERFGNERNTRGGGMKKKTNDKNNSDKNKNNKNH